MKRHTLLVALAAGSVLMAGCGSSTPGTAAPASVALSTLSTNSSSSIGTAGTSISEPSSISSETSSSESTDESSTDTSSSADSSRSESSTDETSSSETSTTTEKTTATTPTSAINATTTKWFTVYCTGLLPLVSLSDLSSQVRAAGTDLAKIKTLLVKTYGVVGASFTSTAASLKALPLPTISGSSAFAKTLAPDMATQGADITAQGKKIAASTASTFAATITAAQPHLTKALGLMSGLAAVRGTYAEGAAIKAIPACKKLG